MFTAFLAGMMLFTGSINTIATKYQDITCVEYFSLREGGECCNQRFFHPVIQSGFMFLGEFGCLLPAALLALHKLAQSGWFAGGGGQEEGYVSLVEDTSGVGTTVGKVKVVLLFAIPALCDSVGTTLLNVGLFFTYASAYQMLRGTIVMFTGILTILIMKRRLHAHHWVGMVSIVFGAFLVGLASVLKCAGGEAHSDDCVAGDAEKAAAESSKMVLFGDILVFLAQVAAATQFIVEEKVLSKYKIPANVAVGLEGFWGLGICAIALPIALKVRHNGEPVENFHEAVAQIGASRQLQVTTLLSVVSIAFFNFFGIMVTKKLSGSSRATIDACRTIFIWIFAVMRGWEVVCWQRMILQILGFAILLTGTSLYNGLVSLPDLRRLRGGGETTAEPLLHSEAGTSRARTQSQSIKPRFGYSGMARSLRMGASYFLSPSSFSLKRNRSSNFLSEDSEVGDESEVSSGEDGGIIGEMD